MNRPRIAVFIGPMATIGNTAPLVTCTKARRKYGLPLGGETGSPRFDTLRAQRLAAPVRVLVEAYSAHPLEADAAHLYAPPDGWLDEHGHVHETEPASGGVPVYEVELDPSDGLYLLPYMARRTDGTAWESSEVDDATPQNTRQSFLPDASRLYEEIDRFGLADDGRPAKLSATAEFDFFRAAPGGGWTKGLPSEAHTDHGRGDPERLGVDYFPYEPPALARTPSLRALAEITNLVQVAASTNQYAGIQWLESSATIEETLYWLGLLIDTKAPIVGHSAQRSHGTVSADGAKNVVDGVKFIASGVWRDEAGANALGAVLIVDEMAYASREVTKVDARPGGYLPVGGHGGVVADLGAHWEPQVTFVPRRRHTYRSDVRCTVLPGLVAGVEGSVVAGAHVVEVRTKNDRGELRAMAMPTVSVVKSGTFTDEVGPDPVTQVSPDPHVIDQIDRNLATAPLSGFVVEGLAPYGSTDPRVDRALELATYSGIPVVRVGRGNPGGMAYRRDPDAIAGNNLTATKARMLLMAAMLKLGALPPATDPAKPTDSERSATRAAIAAYQEIFDTH